jgi:hypothetical protein
LSAALRRFSPYSLYCLVAARLPSRAHLDLEMELRDVFLFFLEENILSQGTYPGCLPIYRG